MTLRWQTMTAEEREREYSPSSCLPDGDYRPFIDAYHQDSDRAWATVTASTAVRTTTISYGDAATQAIDLAVPRAPATAPPLLVFLHGGYWQELSRHASRFAAADAIDRGWAFAAVGYTLAPLASLDAIVEECRQALRTLHGQAETLGVDAERIFVAGSSAGAHLAAMTVLDPTTPSCVVRGAILVSGIFELQPLIGTSIDTALSLDDAAAERNSPLRADLTNFAPSLIAYGSDETSEFKAQSSAFAQRLDEHGCDADTLEIRDRNHFDVIGELAAAGSTLGDCVARFIDTNGGSNADL